MTHERYPFDMKAADIHEWIPVFAESDAGKRPDHPSTNFRLPEYLSFEEYSEVLKDHFHMKMKDGIVEAKAYTPGEAGWIWGTAPHAPIYWQTAKAQAREVLAAEKKGKVVRPRIGKFIEEDIIK